MIDQGRRSRTSQNRPLAVVGNKGGPGLTQDEIADKLGCSRAYVSQVERRALAKLRIAIEKMPKRFLYLTEGP
jgi:transcriptional regulator